MNAFANMKTATGRVLVCISEAEGPLSFTQLKELIGVRYEKLPTDGSLKADISSLVLKDWITNELVLTPAGLKAVRTMKSNRGTNGWAYRFFRKSNSPNIGPRARPTTTVSQPQYTANPNLMVVR